MKKIIITTFLSLLIIPAFSQISRQFKLDTTLKNVYRNPYVLEESKDLIGLLNNPLKKDNLITPNFLNRNLIARQNQNTIKENSKLRGEMPCVIPEGYFPMKVLTPDSSKRYILLIKEL